jgi:hypothetical protein
MRRGLHFIDAGISIRQPDALAFGGRVYPFVYRGRVYGKPRHRNELCLRNIVLFYCKYMFFVLRIKGDSEGQALMARSRGGNNSVFGFLLRVSPAVSAVKGKFCFGRRRIFLSANIMLHVDSLG